MPMEDAPNVVVEVESLEGFGDVAGGAVVGLGVEALGLVGLSVVISVDGDDDDCVIEVDVDDFVVEVVVDDRVVAVDVEVDGMVLVVDVVASVVVVVELGVLVLVLVVVLVIVVGSSVVVVSSSDLPKSFLIMLMISMFSGVF
jgi:hypothetical protein